MVDFKSSLLLGFIILLVGLLGALVRFFNFQFCISQQHIMAKNHLAPCSAQHVAGSYHHTQTGVSGVMVNRQSYPSGGGVSHIPGDTSVSRHVAATQRLSPMIAPLPSSLPGPTYVPLESTNASRTSGHVSLVLSDADIPP
jgi:hypothetical protein